MSSGRHCDLHGKGQDVPVFDNKVRQVKPLFVCFSLNTLPFYGPVWTFWIFPVVIKRLCLLSVPILCNVVEISFITCSFSSLKKVKGILKKRRSITQVFTYVSELIYGSKPHITIMISRYSLHNLHLKNVYKSSDVYRFQSMFNERGSGFKAKLFCFLLLYFNLKIVCKLTE